MDKADLIRNLEHEYFSILAANPGWKKSLVQFLLSPKLGINKDDIWQHRPDEARLAGWDEPDWL